MNQRLKALHVARSEDKLRHGRVDWYRIEDKIQNAEIWIYDEIGYFGITASDFVKELQDVKAKSITLHLNSPGGDVFDGFAIYMALKEHPATINVQVDALAASIASVIAMAGDKVTVARNSQLMIHDGYTLAGGNAEALRKSADLLDKISDNIADVYAQKTSTDAPAWRAKMQAETWFSAQEAVDAGLADEIRGEDSEKNSFDLSIYAFGGRENAPTTEIIKKEEAVTPATLAELFQNALKGK